MKMYGKVRVDKERYDGLDIADTADLVAFRDLFKGGRKVNGLQVEC